MGLNLIPVILFDRIQPIILDPLSTSITLTYSSIHKLGHIRTDTGSREGSSVLQVGSRIVQVGSSVLQVGSSVLQVGSRVLQVGSSVLQVGSSVVQVGSSVLL